MTVFCTRTNSRRVRSVPDSVPQDPVSVLRRYLSERGIRVIDLFRMLDTRDRQVVSKDNFIRGLKVIYDQIKSILWFLLYFGRCYIKLFLRVLATSSGLKETYVLFDMTIAREALSVRLQFINENDKYSTLTPL